MALKVADMYWRMFIDGKLRIYTITAVPLSEPTHQELVASYETLKAIGQLLYAEGWQKCQRGAFEMFVREEAKRGVQL